MSTSAKGGLTEMIGGGAGGFYGSMLYQNKQKPSMFSSLHSKPITTSTKVKVSAGTPSMLLNGASTATSAVIEEGPKTGFLSGLGNKKFIFIAVAIVVGWFLFKRK